MYVAQQRFGLSDEGIEEALYDSRAVRRFVGIDLSRESAPDATALLKFRRLPETHGLTPVILETRGEPLAREGSLLPAPITGGRAPAGYNHSLFLPANFCSR
ncbi:MAG: hypothetical protein Kow0073_11230 [Immundisolibacter sp.]